MLLFKPELLNLQNLLKHTNWYVWWINKQTNRKKIKNKIKRVVRSQSCDNDVDEDDL